MGKPKDIAKLRNMTPEELDKEELELREEVWKLRLQRTTGQLQDPYTVRSARRNLARLLTVRREKELAAAKSQSR
jgi:large subunit ribosomal protein L29